MWKIACMAVALFMCLSGRAEAQFSMLIPSSSTVMEDKESSLKLDVFLRLSHGDAGPGYAAAQVPDHYQGREGGRSQGDAQSRLPSSGIRPGGLSMRSNSPACTSLPWSLPPISIPRKTASSSTIPRLSWLLLATKGWDVPLGLKMEIIPLTRPFANYSGNIFQGRVLLDGKPVPGAEVEVEYYNRDDAYTIPNVYFMTQVIKTDENGVFTYCAPWPGWWGFAALKTDRKKMEHQGALKDVELGAVIWMEFTAPLKR